MPADHARIATALQVLDHPGLTVADLRVDPELAPPVPSMGEYLPRVEAGAGPGASRTYAPYWRHLGAALGERPLDAITASDIEALQWRLVSSAASRRNSRGGRYSGGT